LAHPKLFGATWMDFHNAGMPALPPIKDENTKNSQFIALDKKRHFVIIYL
jgi:hypothetical protein